MMGWQTVADAPLTQRLYDADCMIEGIWPLPMPNPPEALLETVEYRETVPVGLESFVADWSPDETIELFEGGEAGRESWLALFEEMYMRSASGFLVCAAVPVFDKCGSGVSYSWGHYATNAFYAPTADAALNAAIEWATARRQKVLDAPEAAPAA